MESTSRFCVLMFLIMSVAVFPCCGLALVNHPPLSRDEGRLGDSLLYPTPRDVAIDQFYREHKILGTSRVKVCTTKQSVGGRGLFWTSTQSAKKGDVLAYIPSHLCFVPSNLDRAFPDLKNKFLNLNNKTASSLSWQSILAMYACHAVRQRSQKFPFWLDWIEAWEGGGPGPARPASYYSDEETIMLAEQVKCSVDIVREMIDIRYETMVDDWYQIKDIFIPNEDNDWHDMFSEFYTIVLSRTANLGPEWTHQHGIIPLHEMINHPPSDRSANVELFCVGDVKSAIGEDNLRKLLSPIRDGNDENVYFHNRDFLLAASRKISPGEELLLSYKNTGESLMEDKEKVWLLLQYGFPM